MPNSSEANRHDSTCSAFALDNREETHPSHSNDPSQEHAPFMTRMLRAVMRVMPCWHTVVASTTPYRHESTSTALAILSEACAFLQISSYFPHWSSLSLRKAPMSCSESWDGADVAFPRLRVTKKEHVALLRPARSALPVGPATAPPSRRRRTSSTRIWSPAKRYWSHRRSSPARPPNRSP